MQNTNLKFDNEIKRLAKGVYQGNENDVPKSWLNLAEHKNDKTGFYGQAFYKDGKVWMNEVQIIDK